MMENSKPNNAEDVGNNKQEDRSADKADMLQHEKLIDPGNEHSHHVDDEEKPVENKEARFDVDEETEPTTTKQE